jgi:hypothetical protein
MSESDESEKGGGGGAPRRSPPSRRSAARTTPAASTCPTRRWPSLARPLHRSGRKPPFWAVTRPARRYENCDREKIVLWETPRALDRPGRAWTGRLPVALQRRELPRGLRERVGVVRLDVQPVRALSLCRSSSPRSRAYGGSLQAPETTVQNGSTTLVLARRNLPPCGPSPRPTTRPTTASD